MKFSKVTLTIYSYVVILLSHLQSPISVSLLKLDPTNLQLNKLAVDCFLSELAQNNQLTIIHALYLDIMKFMGDYMSKGKSEKELALTILKVWNHYSYCRLYNLMHLSIDSS